MNLQGVIRGQRCGRGWLWDESEIALLLSGRPVPTRSRCACETKRSRLTTLKKFRRRRLPYDPPKPTPGMIPWPTWWDRAHQMRREGYRPIDIANLLAKRKTQVREALYPDFREKCLENKRRAYLRNRENPSFVEAHRKRHAQQDHKRLAARAHAREEWRAAGGKPNALIRFYRRYECL